MRGVAISSANAPTHSIRSETRAFKEIIGIASAPISPRPLKQNHVYDFSRQRAPISFDTTSIACSLRIGPGPICVDTHISYEFFYVGCMNTLEFIKMERMHVKS